MDNNLLVLQSGGCTPVINRSLYGVVAEAREHTEIGRVYGARHGIEGVLEDRLLDLSAESGETMRRVADSPAAALGTSRHKLAPEDTDRVLDRLKARGVRYLHVIGGNDSAQVGHDVSEAAAADGYELRVVNVPKTIDNDLVLTDHTPGYGSGARFVALATLGAGLDAESLKRAAPITIIEVMGRDAGWLAASAALARQAEGQAPHVLGLPEMPVDEDRFIGLIEDAYRRYGFAVAVVAENTRGEDGVLGGHEAPYYTDPYGHEYYDGPARYLGRVLMEKLGVRVRDEKPGTIQRSFIPAVSSVDAAEAELAGRTAVRRALEGCSGWMVSFSRPEGGPYKCETGLAPLADVAGAVRRMPEEYLDRERYYITDAFLGYARPLIGDALPEVPRLGGSELA